MCINSQKWIVSLIYCKQIFLIIKSGPSADLWQYLALGKSCTSCKADYEVYKWKIYTCSIPYSEFENLRSFAIIYFVRTWLEEHLYLHVQITVVFHGTLYEFSTTYLNSCLQEHLLLNAITKFCTIHLTQLYTLKARERSTWISTTMWTISRKSFLK